MMIGYFEPWEKEFSKGYFLETFLFPVHLFMIPNSYSRHLYFFCLLLFLLFFLHLHGTACCYGYVVCSLFFFSVKLFAVVSL